MSEDIKMIGRTVEFSTGDRTNGIVNVRGEIIDKIDMKSKPDDTYTITGYVIQDESGTLHSSVAHWRVKKLI